MNEFPCLNCEKQESGGFLIRLKNYNKDILNEEIIKKSRKSNLLFLLIVVDVNVLLPLFCKKPDKEYAENLRKTEFTAETTDTEKICALTIMKKHFCGGFV